MKTAPPTQAKGTIIMSSRKRAQYDNAGNVRKNGPDILFKSHPRIVTGIAM